MLLGLPPVEDVVIEHLDNVERRPTYVYPEVHVT
jgi:hypothetical protein